MKVISGVLPETWVYFCMKNFICTTRNCHSHIHESTHFILFALFKVHPSFFFLVWAPADLSPPLPPPLSGPDWLYKTYIVIFAMLHCSILIAHYINLRQYEILQDKHTLPLVSILLCTRLLNQDQTRLRKPYISAYL